jgi:hypothetical protein
MTSENQRLRDLLRSCLLREDIASGELGDAIRAALQEQPAPADSLSRKATALRERMGEFQPGNPDDLRSIERERGWLEAVAHLAKHGGLSHAGRVEAGKMVAASGEWFEGVTAEPEQWGGRGR